MRLTRDIPAVFIALRKKETPVMAKIVAGLTVAYALSPVDLIPDFIPVLGYLDDVILLPSLAALALCLIPPEVREECRKEAEGLWADGTPKRWFFALPVVLLWALVVWRIIRAVGP